MTADRTQLIVLLYQGAIRFVGQATLAIEQGRPEQVWEPIRRAQAIVDELNFSLDMDQGEVAERLRSIYVFCKRQLVDAGLRRDPQPLAEVSELLGTLCESWQGVAAQIAPA